MNYLAKIIEKFTTFLKKINFCFIYVNDVLAPSVETWNESYFFDISIDKLKLYIKKIIYGSAKMYLDKIYGVYNKNNE